MSRVIKTETLLVAAIVLLPGIRWQPIVKAQTIDPGGDTNTHVTRDGNNWNIQGGAVSGDGSNLFHTFERFNVPTGQTANFLSTPEIQNILTQVIGGNASIINGTLQITGSNANLFLLNPAGIVFGPNASLNVPAAFTATTANGIGFNGGFFAGLTNDYQALIGNPNNFIFTTSQPASILNAAHLSVGDRQSLSLIGGTTINTGNLTAPGGQITIAAIPGENLVRINQSGMLLSLDVLPPDLAEGNINPVTLPELLTGGNVSNATNVTVNADGTVSLTGSQVRIPTETGTTIVSGEVSVTTNHGVGGSVTIAGDKVGVMGAQLDASGTMGGGDIRIGGDYQGNGLSPTASRTLVSDDSIIRADASSGNGGRVIVWADDLTGFYGQISAQGGDSGGNGGFVEVSGKDNLIFDGTVDVSASHGQWGTLLLDPTNITISNDADSPSDVGDALPDILSDEFAGEDITINFATLESLEGNIILEATNNITIADGISLEFDSADAITFTADTDSDGAGAFSMDPTQSITASGTDVTISGASMTVGTIDTSANGNNNPGGNITLTASGGDLTAGELNSSATGSQTGGTIKLSTTDGNITLGSDINTVDIDSTTTGQGIGGDIILEVNGDGSIDSTNATLNSSTKNGEAGTIELSIAGNGNIAVGDLNAGATSANGITGDINIDAANGLVDVTGSVSSHNLTVRGSEIDFTGGENTVEGTGNLQLQPSNNNQDITIALSDPAETALDLSTTDLAALADGFEEIIIGGTDGDRTITLGEAATFDDPVQIKGGSTLVGPNRETTWTITGREQWHP
jgi:filamentous hemagglutinin family protein